MVHNHLVLARDLVEPELRPWESKHRPQVRRGINKLLPRLGTPKLRGKSKGRKKGQQVRKAERFPTIRKRPKLPHLVPS